MAAKKQYNPNSSLTGTDFISNNQILEIDFATIHIYPEQWLPSTNLSDDGQLAFVDKRIQAHILDSNSVLKKPLLIGEFGKSSSLQGVQLREEKQLFPAYLHRHIRQRYRWWIMCRCAVLATLDPGNGSSRRWLSRCFGAKPFNC
ncbi:hypothetical protein GOBAR_AA08681 [Gossypium barbadense]|uniref:Mannan endo-1,4-beta-mannosidase n=1 Tax=Gossypium barbadense TaxID=3634 RepID=A0A2P5Y8P8_GOSBA|nr:hypothetical protein GOBAR_AA08681 [Gossypium barbadense]